MNTVYQPLEPLRRFEPLKPFEPIKQFQPIKPFEPLKPFEPPRSFEIAKQIESTKSQQNTTPSLAGLPPTTLAPLEPISVPTTPVITIDAPSSPVGVTTIIPSKQFTVVVNSDADNNTFNQETRTSDVNNPVNIELSGGLPPGYEPVIALEPLDLNVLIAPITQSKETTPKVEIEEGKAKSTLKEIISEIDYYAEGDKDLKEAINNIRVDNNKKVI